MEKVKLNYNNINYDEIVTKIKSSKVGQEIINDLELTEEEIKNCFLKTDGLPVEIEFSTLHVKGNCFLPKSKLNAFRRDFMKKYYIDSFIKTILLLNINQSKGEFCRGRMRKRRLLPVIFLA